MRTLPKWWPSKEGNLLIDAMQSSHVKNCLAMLHKAGHCSESHFYAYISWQPSNPDAHWEAEAEDAMRRQPNAYIDAFLKTMEDRGEPCDESELLGLWKGANSYIYGSSAGG